METLKDIFGLPANATERELRLAAHNARMAEGWVMADDDRARAFVAACPLTPTPHRSPERIGLERGAVGVSPDDRRACWSCRWAPTLSECYAEESEQLLAWIESNSGDHSHPLPTARNCPGYEDKP